MNQLKIETIQQGLNTLQDAGYLSMSRTKTAGNRLAQTWTTILNKANLTVELFQAAIDRVVATRTSTHWGDVKPADVIEAARQLRREWAAEVERREGLPEIPGNLTLPQEHQWLRVYHHRIGLGYTKAQATTDADRAVGYRRKPIQPASNQTLPTIGRKMN